MTDSPLAIGDHGSIRRITVNRPDKLNALNSATLDALLLAFESAAADDSVRVIVLTGAGTKAFVAGADIAEMADLRPTDGRDFSLRGQRLMRRIETLPKPVIAMVNGFALGGGLELAMACHLRIAADTAKVGQPEINLGLIPGFGGTQRLLRLAGRSATLELCLLGAPIDATRAAQLGIVNRVVPAADLDAETMKIAEQLAASRPARPARNAGCDQCRRRVRHRRRPAIRNRAVRPDVLHRRHARRHACVPGTTQTGVQRTLMQSGADTSTTHACAEAAAFSRLLDADDVGCRPRLPA